MYPLTPLVFHVILVKPIYLNAMFLGTFSTNIDYLRLWRDIVWCGNWTFTLLYLLICLFCSVSQKVRFSPFFFADPHHHDLYREYSRFLAVLNNQTSHTQSWGTSFYSMKFSIFFSCFLTLLSRKQLMSQALHSKIFLLAFELKKYEYGT